MYDIQFVIPCSYKESFKQRLIDFLNCYGLCNLGKYKVKVYLLTGTEEEEELNLLNRDNVVVEKISSMNDDPAQKTYDFFYKMTEEMATEAKWTAKIDDDAFNNISMMMEVLSKYDYNNKWYLVPGPEIREEINDIEKKCIDALDLHEEIYPNFYHELEGCWVSTKAMVEIVKNKRCKHFFNKRRNYYSPKTGYTDQALAVAAKLCCIPLMKERNFYAEATLRVEIKEDFLEKLEVLSMKDKINYCHIHPICAEKDICSYKIIKNKINGVDEPVLPILYNKRFVASKKEFKRDVITFKKNGQLLDNRYFMNWGIKEDELFLSSRFGMDIFSIKELETQGFSISTKDPDIILKIDVELIKII